MERLSFDMKLKIAKHGQVVLLGLLGLSLLMNLILLGRQDKVVVLIPGQMTAEYHISQGKYDNAYIADASATVADLFLNSTPATVDWRKEQLLRWVHPVNYQQIVELFDNESKRIKAQKLTTSFSISKIDVNVDSDVPESIVTGYLSRFVAGRQFHQDEVEVKIVWNRDTRGAVLISDLKWVKKESG